MKVVKKNVAFSCVLHFVVLINTEVSKEDRVYILVAEVWGAVREKIRHWSDTFVLYLRTEWQEVHFVMKAINIYTVKCSNTCRHSIGDVVFVYGV